MDPIWNFHIREGNISERKLNREIKELRQRIARISNELHTKGSSEESLQEMRKTLLTWTPIECDKRTMAG